MPKKPVVKLDSPVLKAPVDPKPVFVPPAKPAKTAASARAKPADAVITPHPAAAPITLTAGQPVKTAASSLLVAGPAKPGTYTYSLIVQDDMGVTSKPSTIQVVVHAGTIG